MRTIDADALLAKFNKKTDIWTALTDEETASDFALYCKVADAVEEMPTIGGWISVKDRLPENDDHVLCCTETKAGRKGIVLGYYMGGMWRCGMNSNVTHWQPLPTMPEEEIECNTD